MTTIACTLEALAGDRMVWVESKSAWYPAKKIRRTPTAIFGAAGHAGDCTRFLDWAEAGFPDKKRPKWEDESEGAAWLLMLTADGIFVMSPDDPYPEQVADGYYAIGSGAKAAMAALACGKTLDEAMEIAGQIDPYTRAPFDIETL